MYVNFFYRRTYNWKCNCQEQYINIVKTLRQATSTVCNVKFDDTGWQQSTLPVAQGGLGLSSAVNVSLPAYASSLSDTRQLVGQILQDVFESCPTSEVDSVAERWTELGHELITTDKKPFQRYWSSAVHKALFHSLKALSTLHTSADVGLLSNQTAFIHFHAVSVLVDFLDTPRSTTS